MMAAMMSPSNPIIVPMTPKIMVCCWSFRDRMVENCGMVVGDGVFVVVLFML